MKKIVYRNEEILDKFFKDMQKMLYSKTSLQSKQKILYSAKYWAFYFLRINNHLILEEFKRLQK
jgi:hypothetical protein